jgi:hypothetical protein
LDTRIAAVIVFAANTAMPNLTRSKKFIFTLDTRISAMDYYRGAYTT